MCKQLVKSTHPGPTIKVLVRDQVGLVAWVRNDKVSIQCGPMRERHWSFGGRITTGSGCNRIYCSRFSCLQVYNPFSANKADSGHPQVRSTQSHKCTCRQTNCLHFSGKCTLTATGRSKTTIDTHGKAISRHNRSRRLRQVGLRPRRTYHGPILTHSIAMNVLTGLTFISIGVSETGRRFSDMINGCFELVPPTGG